MINIKREPAYADKLRSYKILLDGHDVGQIDDGQSKSFDIKPGTHSLYLKIDWARSKRITFETTEDQTVDFSCVSSLKGPLVWLAIFYVIFAPHRYITLSKTEN